MVTHKKIGRFEIVSVMGQGAMGTVYKATDPVIERVVAIKTINLELSKEERAEFEERFYREAKSAGRLSHPNIVTIYDVGETDEAAYIAMEFIEGETLRELLDSGVVLPPKRICSIAAHVAMALNYAHENGVVHRDIKPANIMISRNRDVKIMDFGIATIPTGSRTQAGTVLGSPKYMAPEQVAGKDIDGRADIFSLGAVLYEMLTGTTPFNGDNLSAIIFKILNEELVLPSAVNARIPREFDPIIAKTLAKRPEDRYQTAKELARDLRNYEVRLSQESPKTAATATKAKAVHKSFAKQSRNASSLDSDPLDVKTELMPARQVHSRTLVSRPSQAQSRSSWKLAFIGIAVLALVGLAISQLPRKPGVPDVPDQLAQTQSEAPAVNEPSPNPEEPVAEAKAEPAPLIQPTKTPVKTTRNVSAHAISPSLSTQIVVHAPPSDTTPPAQTGASATLSLAITPWGEIILDGKMAGISPPLTRLELSPGTHNIEIRNSTFAPYRAKVNANADQQLKIKHRFE